MRRGLSLMAVLLVGCAGTFEPDLIELGVGQTVRGELTGGDVAS